MGLFSHAASNKSSCGATEWSQEDPDGIKAFKWMLFPHSPVQEHSCTTAMAVKKDRLALPCHLTSCHSSMTWHWHHSMGLAQHVTVIVPVRFQRNLSEIPPSDWGDWNLLGLFGLSLFRHQERPLCTPKGEKRDGIRLITRTRDWIKFLLFNIWHRMQLPKRDQK